MSYSIIRTMTREEEPEQTILIIKRCKMDEQGISEEELNRLIQDMEQTPEDELEYLGDEDMDDENVDDIDEDDIDDDDEDINEDNLEESTDVKSKLKNLSC